MLINATHLSLTFVLVLVQTIVVEIVRVLLYLSFIFKRGQLKIFKVFFVDSKRSYSDGLFDRSQVVKHNSNVFKTAIVLNCANIWNHYLRSFCVSTKSLVIVVLLRRCFVYGEVSTFFLKLLILSEHQKQTVVRNHLKFEFLHFLLVDQWVHGLT